MQSEQYKGQSGGERVVSHYRRVELTNAEGCDRFSHAGQRH